MGNPILTVETQMVKVRIIAYDTSESFHNYDEKAIIKDISEWEEISEEDYQILRRFLRICNERYTSYIVARQLPSIEPIFTRVMKEAKETVDDEKKGDKVRKERAVKSAKTKAKRKKEINLYCPRINTILR